MKKLVAGLLCLSLSIPLVASAYNEYAPNSFDEVERGRAEYQAAAVLIEEGLAPGYDADLLARPHLSRYEFAHAVKALLENKEELTPAQYASLEATKQEYQRELDALGYPYRKKNKNRISFDGDVRLRYTHGEESGDETDARIRIGAEYTIN